MLKPFQMRRCWSAGVPSTSASLLFTDHTVSDEKRERGWTHFIDFALLGDCLAVGLELVPDDVRELLVLALPPEVVLRQRAEDGASRVLEEAQRRVAGQGRLQERKDFSVLAVRPQVDFLCAVRHCLRADL